MSIMKEIRIEKITLNIGTGQPGPVGDFAVAHRIGPEAVAGSPPRDLAKPVPDMSGALRAFRAVEPVRRRLAAAGCLLGERLQVLAQRAAVGLGYAQPKLALRER